LSAFNVVDNLLVGFGVNSLLKEFFPGAYLEYAKKKSMYDNVTIEKAEQIHAENPGFETITSSDITPLLGFVNHLRTEEGIKRAKTEFELSEAQTAAPVIDLRKGCLDSNLYNNVLLGRSGVHAASVLESSLEKNMIFASLDGIEIGTFEGLKIDDNTVVCGRYGILCSGPLSMNLTVSDNRLLGSTAGIAFGIPVYSKFHSVINAQIRGNMMMESKMGISILNLAVLLYDFSVVDNSIICSENGIFLICYDSTFGKEDVTGFQRVIQRNSIKTRGQGIMSSLANVKIIDNDINIESKNTSSTGIDFIGENCTIANNTISASVDLKNGYISQGGIKILQAVSYPYSTLAMKFKIESNRISGGLGNGISIDSNTEGGMINNNYICDMSMNGIAAQDQVRSYSLTVSNNTISNCCSLNGVQDHWWKYAGIVLYRGRNIQILGNKILENAGQDPTGPQFQVGGFYADLLNNTVIADNLFIVNNTPQTSSDTPQAVIHIPGGEPQYYNRDVKIVSNNVKGSNAPALSMGTFVTHFYFDGAYNFYAGSYVSYDGGVPAADASAVSSACDNNSVITNNHFQSTLTPAVKLQTSYSTFSNNFVVCPDDKEADGSLKSAVDLGVGWCVIAIGNVLSAPIQGAGSPLVLEPNVQF
jgi:hypothetical protein